MRLFDRANNIASGYVRTWLPNGRLEGSEWVAINPTRADNSLGSFKINLNTGMWSDFQSNDKGGDFVSLYAYLNYDSLEKEVMSGNYKNIEGAIQAKAAEEILIKYDITYAPSVNDNFEPGKKVKLDWDGYHQLESGLENPPEQKMKWFVDNWGEINNTWYFKRKGKIVLKVVRFIKDGKKDDRPFTLWTNGTETKWRSKSLPGNYPLWNNQELEERQNDFVILTEGQKTASVLDEIITEKYVCVGWYGGCNAVDKQDWEPLRGREVYFPFDADTSGRKAIPKIKEIAENLDIKLHVVHPPAGCKKGWDLADAIEDGWTSEDIDEFLNRSEEAEEKYIDDDNAFTFKILGYSGENIVFYPYGSKKVVKYKAASLSKGNLFTLMDRAVWGEFYKKDEGGIAWDCAVNDIIRRAEEKNVFDSSSVRGTGAWIDNGKLVINTGNKLIIDSVEKELYETDGDFVYERGRFAPFCQNAPMKKESSRKLIEALKLVNWENDSSAYLLAGWLLLAPYCGALSWRSNAWITGRKGSGKSWIIDNIANPIVGREFGVMLKGTSSPAGVRQKLASSASACIVDEMESDIQKYAEYIEQNVRMFREASSGCGRNGSTAHGTSDGEGRDWIVQSTALFASIGAALKHGADKSRFTILNIDNSRYKIAEREERFSKLKILAQEFTQIWANAFHSRTYNIFSEVQTTIKIMTDLATKKIGNRRSGDQFGTLVAGAWMCENDIAPSGAEAEAYMTMLEVDKLMHDSEEKHDEENMLDEILSYKIDINSSTGFSKPTIGQALLYWFAEERGENINDDFPGADQKAVKQALEQYGIKPVVSLGCYKIQIAVGHAGMQRILKGTAWAGIYSDMLTRLDGCEKELKGPGRFGGIRKRYRVIDASSIIFDDEDLPF